MQVLGGVVKDEAGAVVGAKVLAMTYFLSGNKTLTQQKDPDPDEPARGWESEFLDLLEVGISILRNNCMYSPCALLGRSALQL